MFISRKELRRLQDAASIVENAQRQVEQAQSNLRTAEALTHDIHTRYENTLRTAEALTHDIHTRYENTLEEVFALRDQIQAFGECLGLELVATQEGGVVAVVGEQKEELEIAKKTFREKYFESFAEEAAKNFMTALALVDREREKREQREVK